MSVPPVPLVLSRYGLAMVPCADPRDGFLIERSDGRDLTELQRELIEQHILRGHPFANRANSDGWMVTGAPVAEHPEV